MTFIRWNILIVPPKLLLSECLILMAIAVVIHSDSDVKLVSGHYLGCPVGYKLEFHEIHPGRTKCYKRVDKIYDQEGNLLSQHLDKSYRFADEQCKNDFPKATVISPKSDAENEWIQRYMQSNSIRYAWLNAYKDGQTQSDWKWTTYDGNITKVEEAHKNWLKAQPFNSTRLQSLGQMVTYRYHCLSMVHNKMASKMKTGWAARDCDALLSYFCVKRPEDTACAEGYRRVDKTCYKILDEKKAHQDAVNECKTAGAMLAEPTDDAAMRIITTFMETYHVDVDNAWLGANETDQGWKWNNNSNTPVPPYADGTPGIWLSKALYLKKGDSEPKPDPGDPVVPVKLYPEKVDTKMAYVCEERNAMTKEKEVLEDLCTDTMRRMTYDDLEEARIDNILSADLVCNPSNIVAIYAVDQQDQTNLSAGCDDNCLGEDTCKFAIHKMDGDTTSCVLYSSMCLNVDRKNCSDTRNCYWSLGAKKIKCATKNDCINNGFTAKETGCYRVMTGPNLTHPGAEIACSKLSTGLAPVNLVQLIDENGKVVQNKANDIRAVMKVDQAWIGASMNETGEWIWFETGKTVEQSDFEVVAQTNTATTSVEKQCMKIFKKGPLYYRLASHDCTENLTAICQKELEESCRKDYVQKGEKCYKFFKTKSSHDAAEDDCKMDGFDLANPQTDDEKRHINAILEKNDVSVWLRSTKTWSRREFADGRSMQTTYSWWKFMTTDGTVKDVDCTNSDTSKWDKNCTVDRPYICETNTSGTFTHCAENYTKYGERCYRGMRFMETYDNALKTCRMKERASLPELYNRNEELKMAMGNQVYDTWLGAARKFDNNSWVWNTTGEEADLDQYNNWMKAEPSNNDDKCAYMLYSPTYRGWGSTSCDQKATTICQTAPIWLFGTKPPTGSTTQGRIVFAKQPCDGTMFKCKKSADNKCIPKEQVCDGHNNCRDSSDEANCDDGAATLPIPVMLMAGLLLMTSQLM